MIDTRELDEVMSDCLLGKHEVVDNAPKDGIEIVKVEGIMNTFGLHRERLESHREEVAAMLAQLPDTSHAKSGGGMSFLNACVDRDGVQWGEHRNMEVLFVLGVGLGLAKWCLPRSMWSALPGGMPYVVVYELSVVGA